MSRAVANSKNNLPHTQMSAAPYLGISQLMISFTKPSTAFVLQATHAGGDSLRSLDSRMRVHSYN